MTFQEMANFLTGTPEIAAIDALNFDGGGSSTMVVNGSVKNLPSDSCGASQRPVANAIMLVKEVPPVSFPFLDAFASAGRQTLWDDKFGYNGVISFAPVSPKGDGFALKVQDASGVNTVRRGDYADTDYAVQADIYCEYRPGDVADGYERSCLFARDSGSGALGLSTYGGGNCYALCYDSGTGLVHAGKYVNGAFADLGPVSAQTFKSGWHRFRIECSGSSLTYRVNGGRILTASDSTFARGYFGVGYQSYFATPANMHGARVDNLNADQGSTVQPADLDFDTDVDIGDFGRFQNCLTGSALAQDDIACQGARLDSDNDVDDADLSLFLGCVSGADITASVSCVPAE